MMTIHSTDRAGDPARPRRLGALGDAGHQQGDDQRDDGHLQRVEPQGADEADDCRARLVRRRPRRQRRTAPSDQPEDQRGQRPISAKLRRRLSARCGFGRFAQRGFRNLNTTRSVLPRIVGSNTSSCDRRPGCAACRWLPTSSKPARWKSALITSGSIRCSFSTVARVSPLGLRDMVDDADHRRPASSPHRAS